MMRLKKQSEEDKFVRGAGRGSTVSSVASGAGRPRLGSDLLVRLRKIAAKRYASGASSSPSVNALVIEVLTKFVEETK